mgnify:CR=1 FL=1
MKQKRIPLVGEQYLVPFILITSLFFLWGFAHAILDVLNKHFQELLDITKAHSAFIQAMMYMGYFVMAIPAGLFISRFGYRRGVVFGLVLYGVGSLLFIPGQYYLSFNMFLFALFVIGCGLTFLETAANPYATELGAKETAASRLNFAQSFNGLGCICAPVLVGLLLFSEDGNSGAGNVALPYVGMGIVVLLVALVFSKIKLPEIEHGVEVDKDWDTVVENENVLGRSLIYASAKSSWKSTADGAYDWESGSWYELDSGGWVQASSALVQYALDPRNFLNETNVFMFEDLSYNSSVQSETGVSSIIEDTFMDGSSHDLSYDGTDFNYPSALMYAGRASGVSPYHLATRIIQEQGRKGQGNSISGTVSGYEGYYNYYNQGAYKTATASAVVNGLKYAAKTDAATLRPWNTRMKSVIGGAIYIGSRYINRGQNTIYYEKFDMVTPYTHQYMTNVLAPRSESSTASQAYSDTTKKNTALVFKIPVYKNMPDSACELPTGEGSPNNALTSLSVSGYSLTPTFDMFTTEYGVIVENEISSVDIEAQTADSSAKLTGTGSHALKVGTNEIEVTVTSQSGETKTYIIRVVRKEAASGDSGNNSNNGGTDSGNSGGDSGTDNGNSGGDSEKGGYSTDFLLENGKISRVGVGSAAQDVLNHISFTGGAYGKVTHSDGSANDGIVGTGDVLTIYDKNGGEMARYTFVIYGDVNGDGAVTSMDLLYVKRHILGTKLLEEPYLTAADANRGNDGITSIDLLYIKRHILDIRYIEQ